MCLRNTLDSYGFVAKAFHWLLAVLIIAMLAMGLKMTTLPMGPDRFWVYGLHKSTGLTILGLVLLRSAWRILNVSPRLEGTIPRLLQFAAHATHYVLYALMFAMPLTGWMMSSAAGFPVSFYGLFVMPDLVGPNPQLRSLMNTTHELLAYVLIALVALHSAAALWHHFVYKDATLKRMLFRLRRTV